MRKSELTKHTWVNALNNRGKPVSVQAKCSGFKM